MPNKRLEWARLEAEYVTTDISIRQLAKREGVTPNVVSRRNQIDGWMDKRAAYRASKSERAYAILADQGALDLARRQMQALAIIEKYATLFEKQIPNYEARIAEGKTPLSVRDYVALANLERIIIGEPTERKEEKHLGLNLHALSADTLDRLESIARSGQPDAGTTNGTLIGTAEVPSAD